VKALSALLRAKRLANITSEEGLTQDTVTLRRIDRTVCSLITVSFVFVANQVYLF
jgi:hypothetical protein